MFQKVNYAEIEATIETIVEKLSGPDAQGQRVKATLSLLRDLVQERIKARTASHIQRGVSGSATATQSSPPLSTPSFHGHATGFFSHTTIAEPTAYSYEMGQGGSDVASSTASSSPTVTGPLPPGMQLMTPPFPDATGGNFIHLSPPIQGSPQHRGSVSPGEDGTQLWTMNRAPGGLEYQADNQQGHLYSLPWMNSQNQLPPPAMAAGGFSMLNADDNTFNDELEY